MSRLISIIAVVALTVAPQESLTDRQVADAIDLGRRGDVPVVRVSSSLGDFNVFRVGYPVRIDECAIASSIAAVVTFVQASRRT